MLAAALSVACQAKNVIGAAKKVANVPADVAHLGRLVEGAAPIVLVAARMATDHRLLPLLHPALVGVMAAIDAAGAVLDDVPFDLEEGEADNEWARWWTAAPARSVRTHARSLTRTELVPQLRHLLAESVTVLSAALASLQAVFGPGSAAMCLEAPSCSPDAVDVARRILQLFARGALPSVSHGSSTKRYPVGCGQARKNVSLGSVWIVLQFEASSAKDCGEFALALFDAENDTAAQLASTPLNKAAAGSIKAAPCGPVAIGAQDVARRYQHYPNVAAADFVTTFEPLMAEPSRACPEYATSDEAYLPVSFQAFLCLLHLTAACNDAHAAAGSDHALRASVDQAFTEKQQRNLCEAAVAACAVEQLPAFAS